MAQWILSKRKADAISNGVFLVGIGILFFANAWWPGILLVIWATLFTREFFTARYYDMFVSSVLLLGLFAVSLFNFNWTIIIPILLILGGIHIIFREYCVAEGIEEEDPIEETEREIEDGNSKPK